MSQGKKFFRLRSTFSLSLLILLFCTVSLQVSGSNNPVDKGKEIFSEKCALCHTVGGGKKVGPDLRGATERHPKSWLFAFIADPEKMFADNDPTAVGLLNEYKIKMPNIGLSPDDINAVISYLETQAGAAPQANVAPVVRIPVNEQIPAGDAGRGEKLFIGQIAFKNGGPPCLACHAAPRIKYLGGGNLGPDLTAVYSSLGGGIVAVLTNVPFPTMKPIFDNHPITPEEAHDLAAFLQGVVSERSENFTARIIALSLIGLVILIAIILFLWRNRLVSVRKAMVERAEREDENR